MLLCNIYIYIHIYIYIYICVCVCVCVFVCVCVCVCVCIMRCLANLLNPSSIMHRDDIDSTSVSLCFIFSLNFKTLNDSSSMVQCYSWKNYVHVDCRGILNVIDIWICSLCFLYTLPYNPNSHSLDSVVDNVMMDNNLGKFAVSASCLHKLMLPNILVKPSEPLLNNQDFDSDINFYDAISK